MLAPGDDVIKVACPDGCTCDGDEIPPGTPGQIRKAKDAISRSLRVAGGNPELRYVVEWKMGQGKTKVWWTFDHGLEAAWPFPDGMYLEGV